MRVASADKEEVDLGCIATADKEEIEFGSIASAEEEADAGYIEMVEGKEVDFRFQIMVQSRKTKKP